MICTTTFNPLVQGWQWPYGAEPTPVIYGALPSSAHAGPKAHLSPRDTVLYHMSHYRPDVLNSFVSDAHGRKHLRITTDSTEGGPTVWRDVTNQRAVALIDWSQKPPMIEIPGLLGRTAVHEWIPLCDDHTYVSASQKGAGFRHAAFERPTDGASCLIDPGSWNFAACTTRGHPWASSSA